MDDTDQSPALDRRRLLTSALLGTGVAALPTAAHAAMPERSPSHGPMTAQAEEGPYYLPLNLMRADITEGLSGIPIDIRFMVVDERGLPYAEALVDIWHCNAQGIYSGFQEPDGQAVVDIKGRTFLRGVQPVDGQGEVVFHSIYPGWYHGRTTHVHFKVRHGGRTNLTSQFFLPDTLSEFLYSQVPAYRRAELRDTLNSDDGIAMQAGDTVEGSVRETKGRYLVTLAVRVDRAATAPAGHPGGPGGLPLGPPPGFPGSMPPGEPGMMGGGQPGRGGPPPQTLALQGEQRVAALLPDAKRVDRPRGPGGPPST
jgi:protocatechuate 3,4-dioxygenase beta subunit